MSKQDAKGATREDKRALEMVEAEAGSPSCFIACEDALKTGSNNIRRREADGPDIDVPASELVRANR
jgi:hypothetical protein